MSAFPLNKRQSSVDTVQAYSLAMHLNGIAVDHRGDAGHVG
jgi:hypothetical protein